MVSEVVRETMPLEPEDLRQLSELFAQAVHQAASQAAQAAVSTSFQQNATIKTSTPPVTISAYRTGDFTSVHDYFVRCERALQLSRIAVGEYKNYILVHMGTELENALKILISPKVPEELTYEEIKTTLTDHFDRKKNQYAESVKFRQVVQGKEETLSNFTLRLRQAATDCNYGTHLDRMLTEQLLFGLESRSTCDEIIAKEPANFREDYEIAQRLEASHKSAVEMKSSVSSSSVMEPTYRVGYDSTKFKNKSKQNAVRLRVSRKKTSVKQNGQIAMGVGAIIPEVNVNFAMPNVMFATKRGTSQRFANQELHKFQMRKRKTNATSFNA